MMIYISLLPRQWLHAAASRFPYTTVPYFEKEAHEMPCTWHSSNTERLTRLLRINNKLATENVLRYHDFYLPMPFASGTAGKP